MRILFLAPQPFFQERGTPIAVRLAVQVLAQRKDLIDLLTYHEGTPVSIPNVTIHRTPALPGLSGIGPGISIKKLLCDVMFLFKAIGMVLKNRRDQYDIVHAVEESVFVALLIKWLFGIPYIYDMDSSLALQLTEKWRLLQPVYPLLALFERAAVRGSVAVVPVCDTLAVLAGAHGASDTHILRDISLLNMGPEESGQSDLRADLKMAPEELLILYIGNLEPYQGVDLLIEGFASIAAQNPRARIAIIGGAEKHLTQYRQKIERERLAERIHLLGPRPVSSLNHYLRQADVLASPRMRGNNTPMKIYSYLHAGRAIIATRLQTHTQVLDDSVAMLSEPTPAHFGAALARLIEDETLRARLGKAAFECAEEKYTFEVFERSLNSLYDRLGKKLRTSPDRLRAPGGLS